MDTEMDGGRAIERLKDHYKHCIRLSASNKINPKNAFDLQLIDYMQDLVSSNEDGQMNFKIASSALDVGAKIYSNRVDCIQSEAQKVASSILMALDGHGQAKDNNNENSDDTQNMNDSNCSDRIDDSRTDANGNEESSGHKKVKKKRSTKNVRTIVEDQTVLDGKLEKMVLGDAFLDGLSQDYDMSCPAALISYNALTQPNCLLTIESSHLRTDYKYNSSSAITTTTKQEQQPPNMTTKSDNLTTIVEEPEEADGDGDIVMQEDDSNQENQDCDKTIIVDKSAAAATINNGGQVSGAPSHSSSNDQFNFVTLITKNVNCAQIIRNNQNNHICPRLESFLFNVRTTTISGMNANPDEELETNQNQHLLNNSRSSGGAHEFNPELYAGNDDNGDDHFADSDSTMGDGDENKPENNNAKDDEDDLPNLDKIAASRPTDYGYSVEHHRLLNTWAGPHAWKTLKAPQTVKQSDAAPKSVRKRAKLEQKSVEYGEEYTVDLQQTADKMIRLASEALRKWKKPHIAEDHNITEDSLFRTMIRIDIKPKDAYHCMKTSADVQKLVDKDHDYLANKMNIDDDAPPSPGIVGGFDDVHDDSDDEFRADPVVEGNEVAIYGAPINNTLIQQDDIEFAGENLIEQPYTVAQVNIPFAKIAKKMDVRKLKRVMWDLLLPPQQSNNVTLVQNGTVEGGDTVHNNTEHSEEQEVAKKIPSPEPSVSPVHLEFSHLYGELPVKISSKMANDLSQPIAFVTLLHLANEKNLRLISKEDLKDFVIEQD